MIKIEKDHYRSKTAMNAAAESEICKEIQNTLDCWKMIVFF